MGYLLLASSGQALSYLSAKYLWEVCLPPWRAADKHPSVPHPPIAVEPTWEAATPFGAVVGAGGAEILWLVVWQSISQSLSHAVVRDVKQG